MKTRIKNAAFSLGKEAPRGSLRGQDDNQVFALSSTYDTPADIESTAHFKTG